MKTSIDLNCDMGESFGAWKMGNDAELMPFISSANIACGFHAGDAGVIKNTVALAIKHGVAIGAHPSYPDLQGFGRRAMRMSATEIHNIVLYQVSALKGIAEAAGARLHHVKPHGALYNDAAINKEFSAAIADAVKACDPELVLYGLSGSHLVSEAKKTGLRAANEVFSDRTYMPDGMLTPRGRVNALIKDPKRAVEQVVGMVMEGKVVSINGEKIAIAADTVCIHGDGARAADFARSICQKLSDLGIEIKTIQ